MRHLVESVRQGVLLDDAMLILDFTIPHHVVLIYVLIHAYDQGLIR